MMTELMAFPTGLRLSQGGYPYSQGVVAADGYA
jgi:hypothetical protein